MSQNLPDGLQPSGPRPDLGGMAQRSTSPARPAGTAAAYTPPPGSQAAPVANSAKQPPSGVGRFLALGAVAAAAIAGGFWLALSGDDTSTPAPAATVPAPAIPKQEKTFAVGPVDADLKATEQLKAILAGGAPAESAPDELQAVNTAGLTALARSAPALADDLRQGRRLLYRLYLLDYLAQDGDHVELFVNGMTLGDVALVGAGTSFLIPLSPGTTAQLKLVATADGGGGVTVGFISSAGEARTQVMQVGEFDQWQVTVP